jgi:Formyl transferase
MRITVFTSNQPRHLALIERLASVADELFAVQECNTVFPGRVEDFFRKSETMQRYFARVIDAETQVFGAGRFLPSNVRQLPIKMGDLSLLDLSVLAPSLQSDVYVVFGASYIKGALCDHLVERGALNIHMGISPQYRGSSTNFWALYDRNPQLVGATIHLLSKGLDSGPMLFHALPAAEDTDPFVLGMRAVRAAHEGLARVLQSDEFRAIPSVSQCKKNEIRYTRNADFTDAVANDYLSRLPTPQEIGDQLRHRDLCGFLRPCVAA